ncbi:MAG: type II 3-dehydroquinate dehydratase [bacterium]|nr:type II 3-dehydroquinate dehydratase [bacterium]
MKNILIINGPNLNLLGKREPEIYGSLTLKQINANILKISSENTKVSFFQSNIEGEIVDQIGKACTDENIDGIVINPGAYTHTSIAIHDAIKASHLPVVEVHLSSIYQREDFRHKSIISAACIGQIFGFGAKSYELGLEALLSVLR